MSKRIHVVPHGSGWATRREGATRVGSTHSTQADATQAARGTAIRERGEVIIHRPDGRIGTPIRMATTPFRRRADGTGPPWKQYGSGT